MMTKRTKNGIKIAALAVALLASPLAGAQAQQAVSPTEVDQVMGTENLPTRPAAVRPAYIPHQEASIAGDAEVTVRQLNRELENKRMLGLF